MSKTRATEREFQGHVTTWVQKEIDKGYLPFGNVTSDSSIYGLKRVKFPDVLLTSDFECRRAFCGWELKTPKTAERDRELLKDAVEKAKRINSKYFVTWNMQTAIIWKTPKGPRKIVNEDDKEHEFGPIYDVTKVNDIRDPKKALMMEDMCAQLLGHLSKLYKDERTDLPVADRTFFVNLVSYASGDMERSILKDINKARSNKEYDKKLNAWAKKQGVNRYDQNYYQTLAQQISYKIIGKILFYLTLRRHRSELPPMELPQKSYKAAIIKMRKLFAQALEIDYQAIFEHDITDDIDLSKETAGTIIKLTENLSRWSFDLMPLDVVGSVFENLIPQEARHSLGQYFTPNDLVDLIIGFCVQNGEDKVMDPTCGTGTFLIRSYQRLRNLNIKKHHELIENLWGFDISSFAAELATINLYRQDLSDYLNFPRVLARDFFDVKPSEEYEFPPPKKTESAKARIKVQIPKFDALVGNFPYIRQELIEKAEKGYKSKLESILYDDWCKKYAELFKKETKSNQHKIKLTGQADIYAYMFFHAGAHLNDGGRMGFVTSNSWLDVAYGYEMQKFFLSRFKIIAILESRCEPWFEQSAVNTIVSIVERCNDEGERKNNSVRFVKIKKPLNELFPEDAQLDANSRWNKIEAFVGKIESLDHSNKASSECKVFERINEEYVQQPKIVSYENEDIRVRTVKQEELYEQVLSAGQTVKWGQYLRGPDTYFHIISTCGKNMIPLEEIATIRFGIKTGVNKFFYLTEDDARHWGIESKFLEPVIKSPKECTGIKVKKKELPYKVFLCQEDKKDLKGTNALEYIKWGEQQKTAQGRSWNNVETVRGRKNWYSLTDREPGKILLAMTTGSKLRAILNICSAQVDHRLFEIIPKEDSYSKELGIFLNTGISFLFRELVGRANLGDGALETEGIDWKRMLVPKKEALDELKDVDQYFEKICRRKIYDIKKEASRKDRIDFEKAVLKKMGLNKDMAKPILESVSELVKERYTLPKMRSLRKKYRVQHDYEKLQDDVVEEVLGGSVKRFPESFVKGWDRVECEEISIPAQKLFLGEKFFGKQEICDDEGEHILELANEDKAKYIVYAKKKDEYVVKVPKNPIIVTKAVKDYEIYLKEISNHIYTAVMEKCGDHTVAEDLTRKVFEDFGLPT